MEKKQKHNKFVTWLKGWSSYAKNKTINTLIFLLAFFIIGGSNHFIIFGSFVPTFFILDFFLIIFMVAPIFFFRKTMFDRIYLPIIIAFLTFFYALNACFYTYFGTVFSLKDIAWGLQNIAQVGYHSDLVPWWIIIVDIVLFILFGTGIVLFNVLWKFDYSTKELRFSKRKQIALGLSMLGGGAILFESSLQIWCACERGRQIADIDFVEYSPNYHFNRLGMLGYYIQELRQMLFDRGEPVDKIKEYLTSATYLKDDYTNFFEKHGITAKPNVIVIMIETGDACMLNQATTPNLWRVLNGDNTDIGGLNCSHTYSINHTNQSDLLGITGNYPQFNVEANNVCSTPFALPNILKDKKYHSYITSDLADVNDIFHTQELMHKIGFENYWFHNDIIPNIEPWEYRYANYTRDSYFMLPMIEKIKLIQSQINSDPFYMHYITIHMHMDQVLNDKNKEIYESLENQFGQVLNDAEQLQQWINPFTPNTEDSQRFRRYTLKTMDFDYGLGQLIETLYDSNDPYLENTLLLLYGDHSWYENCQDGSTFAQSLKNIYDNENIKQYSTILGIYHPVLNEYLQNNGYPNHKYTNPTWPSVVVPTILDLLGITYNPRIYHSKSIFDASYDTNEIFYSYWKALFMNEHYTSNDGHSISSIWDDNKSQEKFEDKLKEIMYQFRIINTIYKNDIFGHYNYDEFMPKIRIS